MSEIVIIGGSIVGLQLAVHLARKGFKSTIIEEHKEIGLPIKCTGLISKKGSKEIAIKIDEFVLNELSQAIIKGPYGSEIKLNKKNAALLIDRVKLEKELAKEAQALGVKIKTNTSLISKRNQTLFLKSSGKGEIIKHNLLIGCDGARSKVREIMNIPIPKENKFLPSYQTRIKARFNPEEIKIYFGNFASGLFAWIVPENKNIARVGLASNKENLIRNHELFMERTGLHGTILEKHFSLIPIGMPLKNIAKENSMILGDAAFHTKASTGGGIIFGSIAAKTASKIILDYLKNGKPLEEFNKRIEKTIYKELVFHYKINKFLQSMNEIDLDELIKKIHEAGLEKVIEKHGDMEFAKPAIKKLFFNPKAITLFPKAIKFFLT